MLGRAGKAGVELILDRDFFRGGEGDLLAILLGGGVSNAGGVFPISYNYAWNSGYTFSVGESVGLGAGILSNAVQPVAFSQNVSNPYLIVNWIDVGTSFHFGSNSFTLTVS